MKNKIAIITTFRSADEAYSLNRVVIDQIKMFTGAGYPLKVIVAEGFKPEGWYAHEMVECVTIPDVAVSNDIMNKDLESEEFAKDVDLLKEAFKEVLKDIKVAITHDVVYQSAAMKHNLALREWLKQDSPDIKFLHWIHSASMPSLLALHRGGGQKYLDLVHQSFPKSFYISFNKYSVPRLASWFNVEEGIIKYVPHPHDFTEYKHETTKEIVEDLNLLQKDVVMLYPCRLDRGKQPHHVIKIAKAVKDTGRSVCCIIADFHSTGGDKVKYREEMKDVAISAGMNEKEVVFMSEWKMPEGQFRYEMPHQVIQELFEFTNTFILPSKTETYSLVTQEAIAKRNFVVLNKDFPPFRSIYGDEAHYRPFSSNINAVTGLDGETTTTIHDEKDFYGGIANMINYAQESTTVLALFNKVRKEKNLQNVFRKNIEPLLEADPEDGQNY